MTQKEQMYKDIQSIPYLGPVSAKELWDIGIRSADELKTSNPEELYERISLLRHENISKVALYVLRCAKYYLTEKNPDPALLEWWNWKDKTI